MLTDLPELKEGDHDKAVHKYRLVGKCCRGCHSLNGREGLTGEVALGTRGGRSAWAEETAERVGLAGKERAYLGLAGFPGLCQHLGELGGIWKMLVASRNA